MMKCTLALGCFWKPEENFKSKPGIIETEVGYAGGLNPNTTYEEDAVAIQVMLKLLKFLMMKA